MTKLDTRLIRCALDYFKCVPLSDDNEVAEEPVLIKNRGIVLHPTAVYAEKVVENWLSNSPNGEQMNKTFYTSWRECLAVSTKQHMLNQFVHYITAYLNDRGLSDEIIVPRNEQDIAADLRLQVIRGVSLDELVIRAHKTLCQNIAHPQEVIEDLLYILECGEFAWNEEELAKVTNREARYQIFKLLGLYPSEAEELTKYLFFLATSDSLIIGNKQYIQSLRTSNYVLKLTQEQIDLVAECFHRFKNLWLALKKASSANPKVVNTISRRAKELHIPKKLPAIKTVTSGTFSSSELEDLGRRSSIKDLVTAINALKLYQDTDRRFFRVRNGRGWATKAMEGVLGMPVNDRKAQWCAYEKTLLAILKEKVAAKGLRVYCPDYVDYSFPTSRKQMVGNIPVGTKVNVPKDSRNSIVGIYWENQEDARVDLDLTAHHMSGEVVGWYTRHRSAQVPLVYSGDITSGPAAEYVYRSPSCTDPFLLAVTHFEGPLENLRFHLIIGHELEEAKHSINPNNVLFSLPLTMASKQSCLGLLTQSAEGLTFFVNNVGIGNQRVTRACEKIETILMHALASSNTGLKLRDLKDVIEFVDEPDSNSINLSPSELMVDSFNCFVD